MSPAAKRYLALIDRLTDEDSIERKMDQQWSDMTAQEKEEVTMLLQTRKAKRDQLAGIIVIVVIGLLFLFGKLALGATPPMQVLVEQATVAYAPDGSRIALPAGTVIDVCANSTGQTLVYQIDARLTRIPQPCEERSIFADGFED